MDQPTALPNYPRITGGGFVRHRRTDRNVWADHTTCQEATYKILSTQDQWREPMKPISRYLDDALDKGLSKNDSDTARKIGVTRASISDWRNGRTTPNDDQAVKLAELLGRDAGEILAECGAARAKTPETRRAWERIAARMAASSITVCAMIIAIGYPQESKAEYISKLLFSELRKLKAIRWLALLWCDMTECIAG